MARNPARQISDKLSNQIPTDCTACTVHTSKSCTGQWAIQISLEVFNQQLDKVLRLSLFNTPTDTNFYTKSHSHALAVPVSHHARNHQGCHVVAVQGGICIHASLFQGKKQSLTQRLEWLNSNKIHTWPGACNSLRTVKTSPSTTACSSSYRSGGRVSRK